MESSSAAAPAAQELWPEQPVAAAERRVRHLGAGDEQHGRWSRPFSFLQMADTQLGFVETCYENRLPIRVAPDLAPEAQLPAEGFEVELALLNKAVDEINRLRPAFAVVCGDMINAYPAAMGKQDGDKRAAQLGAFKAACGRVHPSVPLVCVCGNHDVGDRPNAASIAQYRGEFGDDYFTFMTECKEPNACSIILRGASKDVLNEIERNLQDALGVARNVVVNPNLAPGGGALEMELSCRLLEKAAKIEGA